MWWVIIYGPLDLAQKLREARLGTLDADVSSLSSVAYGDRCGVHGPGRRVRSSSGASHGGEIDFAGGFKLDTVTFIMRKRDGMSKCVCIWGARYIQCSPACPKTDEQALRGTEVRRRVPTVGRNCRKRDFISRRLPYQSAFAQRGEALRTRI